MFILVSTYVTNWSTISKNTENRHLFDECLVTSSNITMTTSNSGGGIDYRNILFAFPNLTPISGEPTADNLITLKNEIKANASSVASNLGGGLYGHLGLVLNPASYALVSNTPFVIPAHPSVLVVPPGTTSAMATVLREQYAETCAYSEK